MGILEGTFPAAAVPGLSWPRRSSQPPAAPQPPRGQLRAPSRDKPGHRGSSPPGTRSPSGGSASLAGCPRGAGGDTGSAGHPTALPQHPDNRDIIPLPSSGRPPGMLRAPEGLPQAPGVLRPVLPRPLLLRLSPPGPGPAAPWRGAPRRAAATRVPPRSAAAAAASTLALGRPLIYARAAANQRRRLPPRALPLVLPRPLASWGRGGRGHAWGARGGGGGSRESAEPAVPGGSPSRRQPPRLQPAGCVSPERGGGPPKGGVPQKAGGPPAKRVSPGKGLPRSPALLLRPTAGYCRAVFGDGVGGVWGERARRGGLPRVVSHGQFLHSCYFPRSFSLLVPFPMVYPSTRVISQGQFFCSGPFPRPIPPLVSFGSLCPCPLPRVIFLPRQGDAPGQQPPPQAGTLGVPSASRRLGQGFGVSFWAPLSREPWSACQGASAPKKKARPHLTKHCCGFLLYFYCFFPLSSII